MKLLTNLIIKKGALGGMAGCEFSNKAPTFCWKSNPPVSFISLYATQVFGVYLGVSMISFVELAAYGMYIVVWVSKIIWKKWSKVGIISKN